jgi:hypothetical protein
MSYPDPSDSDGPRRFAEGPRHAATPKPGHVASGKTQPFPTVTGPRFPATATRPTVGTPPAGPWPLIADDLFRVAHDREKLSVDRDTISYGLACALLAELGMTGRITVDAGHVLVSDAPPPSDALAHTIHAELAGEPEPLHVHDWLRYLSREAYEQVAKRLIRAGDLEQDTKRTLLGFGRERTVFWPTDNNKAYWPCARLNTLLTRGVTFGEHDRVLAGLCISTGVHRQVFNTTPSYITDGLSAISRQTRPPIPELLSYLDSLVGKDVLIRH